MVNVELTGWLIQSFRSLGYKEVADAVEVAVKHRRGYAQCRCLFPDHRDSTPSFTVYWDKRGYSWYCFGCNRGGRALSQLPRGEGLADLIQQEFLFDDSGGDETAEFVSLSTAARETLQLGDEAGWRQIVRAIEHNNEE